MTGRQKTLRLLMLVVLALCAAAWLLFPSAGTDNAKGGPSSLPSPGLTPGSEPAPDKVAIAQAPPIPPHGTPLPDALPSLQSRADAGDPKAACRLGVELLRCQRLSNNPTFTTSMLLYSESEATKSGNLDLADELARAALHYKAIEQACARLPAGLADQGAIYLRKAAHAGEPEAMLRYADGQGFDPLQHFAYLRSPEFDAWRRDAPGMLARSLESGRPEAAHLLASAYSSNEGMLQGLVPDDPVKARAYQLLLERLHGDTEPAATPAPPLDPLQTAQAQTLAADMHARHFGGRRLPPERSRDGIASFHDPHRSGGPIRTDLAFCDEPTDPAHD